jgi:PAS domain S-box-containing protein
MKHEMKPKLGPVQLSEDTGPTLAELCRAFDTSPENVECEQGLSVLLEGMLDSYTMRKRVPTGTAPERSSEELELAAADKLRVLVSYTQQATAREIRNGMSEEFEGHTTELNELRKELEGALSKEKRIRQKLKSVLDAIDAGVLVVSEDGRIENINQAVAGLTGHADGELMGQPLETLLNEVESWAHADNAEQQASDEHQPLLVERRGFQDSDSGEVVLLNAAEEFNLAVRRQRSIGQISELFDHLSQLCHNINNPLTALMGQTQLMGLKQELDPKTAQSVETITEAATKIAGLVNNLGMAVQDGRDNLLAPLREGEGLDDIELPAESTDDSMPHG